MGSAESACLKAVVGAKWPWERDVKNAMKCLQNGRPLMTRQIPLAVKELIGQPPRKY